MCEGEDGVEKVELQTKIGTLQIDESKVIYFPVGILGFAEHHRYVVVEQQDSVFSFLQSLDEPELSFVVIMPELVRGDYSVQLSQEQIELLQIDVPEDARVYGIVTIPENVADMTVNLQAPVIINSKNMLGTQVIIPGDQYHTKHNVIAEMHKNAFLLQKERTGNQNEQGISESV